MTRTEPRATRASRVRRPSMILVPKLHLGMNLFLAVVLPQRFALCAVATLAKPSFGTSAFPSATWERGKPPRPNATAARHPATDERLRSGRRESAGNG